MKSQVKPIYIIICLLVTLMGCKSLSNDTKSLYINHVIGSESKMSIHLEDHSRFDIDVQNFSSDTLFLERPNKQSVIITKEKVSIAVDSNTVADLINSSKKSIKVQVRVYHHKSKIVYGIHGLQSK